MVSIKIKEIAKICNVSPATVSRVLNNNSNVKEETKEKILKVVRESNYKQNLFEINNINRNIALVVPNIQDLFQLELIREIVNDAREQELDVLIYNTDSEIENEISVLEKISHQKVRGVILLKSNNPDKTGELKKLIKNYKIPIVLVDKELPNVDVDGAYVDNISGGYSITEVFTKKGYQDILFVTGSSESIVAKERVRGYKNALNMKGIEINENNILYTHFDQKEVIYKKLNQRLRESVPSVIISCNNIITLQCIKVLTELDLKIGVDIVMGAFDDIEIFNDLGFQLSVVYVEAKEIGKIAYRILDLKIKDNSDFVQKVKIVPKLKIRGLS
ncbi:MAG: LacI family DNA-binding transcriptional regulator [Turicibacter sp.]